MYVKVTMVNPTSRNFVHHAPLLLNRIVAPAQVADDRPREIRDATDFDMVEESMCAQQMEMCIENNAAQKAIFAEIDQAVRNKTPGFFFINAPGGTGKTFLATLLLRAARGRGDVALAVSSSGIASLLLPMGKTAHSTFKIPVTSLDKDSVCSIKTQQGRAELMRQVKLIIWDEAPMCHRHALEAVDRTLRFLRNNDQPFGGVVFVTQGDFRQVLPVLPQANRGQVVRACMKRSELWRHVNERALTINMRVQNADTTANAEKLALYADFLLRIGDGTEPAPFGNSIQIPHDMILPDLEDGKPAGLQQLIEYTYGDRPPVLRPQPIGRGNEAARAQWTRDMMKTARYYQMKAILTPKNKDVEEINT